MKRILHTFFLFVALQTNSLILFIAAIGTAIIGIDALFINNNNINYGFHSFIAIVCILFMWAINLISKQVKK